MYLFYFFLKHNFLPEVRWTFHQTFTWKTQTAWRPRGMCFLPRLINRVSTLDLRDMISVWRGTLGGVTILERQMLSSLISYRPQPRSQLIVRSLKILFLCVVVVAKKSFPLYFCFQMKKLAEATSPTAFIESTLKKEQYLLFGFQGV